MTAFFLMTEYGQRPATTACVKSITDTCLTANLIIIGDDCFKPVPKPDPDNAIVKNYHRNVGYVRNCNRLAREVCEIADPHDIFFVINNDITFHPGAIERLIIAASAYGKPVVGPRVNVPAKYINASEHTPRQFLPASEPVEMTILSGCCLVMQSSVWFDLDGFDEDFQYWFSDDDFCIRAKQAGHPVIYVPSAVIDHHVGLTLKASGWNARKDRAKFNQKHPHAKWNPTGIYEI